MNRRRLPVLGARRCNPAVLQIQCALFIVDTANNAMSASPSYPSSRVEHRHLKEKNHQVLPFPAARRMVIDAGRLGVRRHITFGLLEFDVTRARVFIREHKAPTGKAAGGAYSHCEFAVGLSNRGKAHGIPL